MPAYQFRDDCADDRTKLITRWQRAFSDRFRPTPRTCLCFRGRLMPRYAGTAGPGGEPMLDVRRREFIALLGGAAAAWPRALNAEQAGSSYRISFLALVPE